MYFAFNTCLYSFIPLLIIIINIMKNLKTFTTLILIDGCYNCDGLTHNGK